MPEATKITSGILLPEASVPWLPPLSINSMTQSHLKQLIPLLMKAVSYKEVASTFPHPCWWPQDIPWYPGLTPTAKGHTLTDNMKAIVRSYYRHLGQENKLFCDKLTNWKLSLAQMQQLQALQSKQAEQLHSVKTVKNGEKPIPFIGIYMCFFCSKEFVNKEDLRKHQSTCDETSYNRQSKGRPAKLTRSPIKGSGLHLFIPQTTLSTDQFMLKLDLLPLSKAKKLRERSRKSTEVNTIDFSDPQVPITPTTPKTPKLLISQLSRDQSGNSCKRRLSYLLQKENVSDTESTVSSENEEHEGKRRVMKSVSLFSIPVSSALGSRVLKHMVSDSPTPHVVTNAEEFCKTPKKNKFADRLRVRDNAFPISFKPRRRYKFFHLYKFSKAQTKEFFKTVNTGLNKNSRKLRRSLPKCSVRLVRLTRREINKHTHFSHKPVQSMNPTVSVKKLNDNYFFPSKPILLSENIDRILGLRKKKEAVRKLSLMNVVSENTNVEMLKQKVVVYRSLLTDISLSNATQKVKPSKPSGNRPKRKVAMVDTESSSHLFSQRYLQVQQRLHSAKKKMDCDSVCMKHLFPHLSQQLDHNPTRQSSISSSPESIKSVRRQLNIDIPSTESSLSQFLLGSDIDKQLREHRSPDSISIMTESSDEDSWREHCCTGCRLRKECRCTPCQGIDDASEVDTPAESTLCKIRLQGVVEGSSTAIAPLQKQSCCETILESPKTNEVKESSVLNSQPGPERKKQTRSSISVSSAAAISHSPTVSRQTSAPAACNMYSLRSNLSGNVSSDLTNPSEHIKISKSSVKKSVSVSLLSNGRVQRPIDESPSKLSQTSSIGSMGRVLDAGEKTNMSLRSSASSARSVFSHRSHSKLLSKPSTRNSSEDSLTTDASSMFFLSHSPRSIVNELDMIRTSSCLNEDEIKTEDQSSKSDVFVNDNLKNKPVKNVKSLLKDADVEESAKNMDEDFDISDQFTRVDADILLRNVRTVESPTSLCKEKSTSINDDALTVNDRPRLRKQAVSWTQSTNVQHGLRHKRRKLDS